MSSTVPAIYDSIAAARRLTDAGMSQAQAEAVVQGQIEFLESHLATKDDLEKFRIETDANFKLQLGEIQKLQEENKNIQGKLRILHEDNKNIQGKIDVIQEKNKNIREEGKNILGELRTIREENEKFRNDVSSKIAEFKSDVIKWVAGMGFTTIALNVVLLALLLNR